MILLKGVRGRKGVFEGIRLTVPGARVHVLLSKDKMH